MPQSTTPTSRQGSARWRVIGWVMLTTAIAVVSIIVAVRQVLLKEVNTEANAQIVQELAEFRTFADNGVNPKTTRPFDSAEDLLTTYIARQYSGYSEQLIGVTDNRIIFFKEQADHATGQGYRLYQDEQFITDITQGDKVSGVEHTPAGTIHWGRVDINPTGTGKESGYLIVVEYTQPDVDHVNHTVNLMAGIGAAALALAFAMSWLVAGQITKPMRELRKVAADITEKDITARVPVRGNDDIAAMSRTFNQMLDRLEESSATQRQFLDDVSHELRTPITIVRGHLELMERSSSEQEATLALVDDELERMGRIVADLLLLAKSERPDFVRPTPTDVADLMIVLDSKVQVFTRNRWVINEIADGTVALDGQRVTQAMVQLCANASQYSPAGSLITLGSAYRDIDGERHIDFWVRDAGPGVKPEDAEHLFDRFHRNNAKNPATAQEHSVGVGLGLSIVRAIAESHRGTAWVRQPDSGPGAIFGISIPSPVPLPVQNNQTPERTP
ncbi:histidine kinase dimerization/phospho-acceptor domain-containing protein [Rothia sp. LK2588]|uniref:sensor histidine kinase n=1 Tax=Rothia sp. LK2588 TaxID=3114369 RepID=UPI0034CD0F8E